MKAVIALLIVMMVILLPNAQTAFAISFSIPTDFSTKLKFLIEDIQELITFNQQKKIDLILQHANLRQIEIDELDKNSQPIPDELEQRRISKLQQAQAIIDKNQMESNTVSALDRLIDKIKTAGELNEIRILHSKFATIKNYGTEQDKQDFNDSVNSLRTWNDYCIGTFDLRNFADGGRSYDKLSDQCPKLKPYSQSQIKTYVSGNA